MCKLGDWRMIVSQVFVKNKSISLDGEMTQGLRVLTALPEDLG